MAEEGGQIVGFLSFSFEFSDWRNGAFFWMQGMEIDSNAADKNAITTALKSGFDTYKATLDFQCCCIRVLSPSVLHAEVEHIIQAFNLETSHYLVYHIDTTTVS